MAVSENTGGTQACVINTEHTLATITAAGTYQLGLDLNALANGDVLEVRIYTKVRTGATSRVAWLATYQNAQGTDAANAYSPPLMSHTEWKATIKQTAGTGRSIIWTVTQV